MKDKIIYGVDMAIPGADLSIRHLKCIQCGGPAYVLLKIEKHLDSKDVFCQACAKNRNKMVRGKIEL